MQNLDQLVLSDYDKKAGVTGSFNIYEEYSNYDERSFLPTAYARNANFSPELNLSIMDGGDQNLTPSQRLFLQWYYCFGHKGFIIIQYLYRHLPFGSEKFLVVANFEIPKCYICEFSKGRHISSKLHLPICLPVVVVKMVIYLLVLVYLLTILNLYLKGVLILHLEKLVRMNTLGIVILWT